jgi:hypothetical protein
MTAAAASAVYVTLHIRLDPLTFAVQPGKLLLLLL